jgi:hypothetical protein
LIEQIAFAICSSNKKVPTPQFTYQWFYDITKPIIENDDTIYSVFYDILNGNLLQHTAYSNQLQFLIDINKKRVAINYYPLNWKEIVGSRINPLIQHLTFLKQSIG